MQISSGRSRGKSRESETPILDKARGCKRSLAGLELKHVDSYHA
jgi:hypothetical protein